MKLSVWFGYLLISILCLGQDPLRLPFSPDEVEASREYWYGIYANDQKIGFVQIRFDKVNRDGTERIRLEMSTESRGQRFGEKFKSTRHLTKEFDTTAPYDLIYLKDRQTQGSYLKEVTLSQQDNGFRAVIHSGDQTREETIDDLEYTLEDLLTEELWFRKNPKVGDRLYYRSLSVDDLKVEIDSMLVKKISKVKIEGVTKTLYDVEYYEGETYLFRGSVDEQGVVVSGQITEMINYRRETEEQARDLNYESDIFSMGVCQVNQPLGDPNRIKSLELTVEGKYDIPSVGHQVVFYDPKTNVTTLRITQELTPIKAEKKDQKKALEMGRENHEALKKLAEKITTQAETSLERVAALLSYVDRTIEDNSTEEPLSVDDILAQRKGDCTEHALLFKYLCRSIGIPARDASGLVYMGDDAQAFGGHRWSEVVIDGQWLPVDPSWGEMNLNPTHILFETEHDPNNASNFRGKPLTVKTIQHLEAGMWEKIGKNQAEVWLPHTWKRTKIDASLGDDQFTDGRQVMIILELEGMIDNESEFAALQERVVGNLKMHDPNLVVHESRFFKDGDLDHQKSTFTFIERGITTHYCLDYIGKRGLAYWFMNFGIKTYEKKIEEHVENTLKTFKFPGPDSPWGMGLQPELKSFELGNNEVTLAFQPSLFKLAPGDDSFISFMTTSENAQFHLFENQFYDDPDEFLDLVAEMLESNYGDLEMQKNTYIIDSLEAVQAFFTSKKHPTLVLATTILNLPGGPIMEVRFLAEGAADPHKSLYLDFMKNIQIKTHQIAQAYPSPKSSVEKSNQSELISQLLEKGQLLGQVDFTPHWMKVTDESQLLLANGNSIHSLNLESGTVETLHQFEDWNEFSSAIIHAGTLHITNEAQEIFQKKDGSWEQLSINGRHLISSYKNRLIMIQHDAVNQLLPDIQSPSTSRDRIIALDMDGTTDPLSLVGTKVWKSLRNGNKVLLIARPAWNQPEEHGLIALIYDLKKKTLQRHSTWKRVYFVGLAPDGWLISGAGKHPDGLYQISGESDIASILHDSDIYGLKLDRKNLVCGFYADGAFSILKLDADHIKSLQGSGSVQSPEQVQIIGEELFSSHPMLQSSPTEQELTSWVQKAQDLAREKTGSPFPEDLNGIDELLQAMGYQPEIGYEGTLLLSFLFSNALIKNGATYVLGDTAWTRQMGQAWGITDHCFGVAYHPYAVVVSTLLDSEGWWTPATTIMDSGGRPIFIGSDQRALLQTMNENNPPDWPEILSQDNPKSTLDLLTNQWDNTYLRRKVYEASLANHPIEFTAELISQVSNREDRQLVDDQIRAAYLIHTKGPYPISLKEWLFDCIETHPSEAIFYFTLGEVYKESDLDDRYHLAKACFSKAKELGGEELTRAVDRTIEDLETLRQEP